MDRTKSVPLLHLHSGIPVLDVEGEWDETTNRSLEETVVKLARAGHFDIIVNLSRTTRLPLQESSWQVRMERLAASVGAHGGHLDIVGTLEQIKGCQGRHRHTRLRWATSEEEAIGRIKGVPVWKSGPIVQMRLS
jgi:hypothetical protein